MPSLSWDWAWPKPDHRTPSGSSIRVQDPAPQHPLVGSWIRSGVTGIETRYPKHAFKPLHHRPPHFPYAAPHQDNFVFALVCAYEEFRNLAFYSGFFLKHHSVCAHVAMGSFPGDSGMWVGVVKETSPFEVCVLGCGSDSWPIFGIVFSFSMSRIV